MAKRKIDITHIINIVKKNIVSLVFITIMTLGLNSTWHWNPVLVFFVLLISYIVLGIAIEILIGKSTKKVKPIEVKKSVYNDFDVLTQKLSPLKTTTNAITNSPKYKTITNSLKSTGIDADLLVKTSTDFELIKAEGKSEESDNIKSEDKSSILHMDYKIIRDYNELVSKFDTQHISRPSKSETIQKAIKIQDELLLAPDSLEKDNTNNIYEYDDKAVLKSNVDDISSNEKKIDKLVKVEPISQFISDEVKALLNIKTKMDTNDYIVNSPATSEEESKDISNSVEKIISSTNKPFARLSRTLDIENIRKYNSSTQVETPFSAIEEPRKSINIFADSNKNIINDEAEEIKKDFDKVYADKEIIDSLFASLDFSDDNKNESTKKKANKDILPLINQTKVYSYPPIELLKTRTARDNSKQYKEEQDIKADKLIKTLKSFGVGAKIVAVTRGPSVTRYEVQPDSGVKVSRIVSLMDDIALNLAASGVRIEAPIPGKPAVGIEVPNEEIETVYLHDVLNCEEFNSHKSKICFALGKDIEGKNIIADIGKMPHLLIAGSTGSGKSVCINTIIASILYKSSPEDVKMIMIDPKVVELGVYNSIPHLLVPVVTDPKKAAGVLNWAVQEMERRYILFAQFNVRDLNSYNNMCKDTAGAEEHIPNIIIVIDELADLMMVACADVEDSIIRLAQKARAAGMHLVIATQRPSVDVITGLIKANIPSRIAFAVSSQVDSRTILDAGGAEKLLGRGDMLYHPTGAPKPFRVQGAFVSDGEIENLVYFLKNNYGSAEYDKDIIGKIENTAEINEINLSSLSIGNDALLLQAADYAFEYNQISASFLQRKLKVGYSRAARLIDTLEELGVVSGSDGSKPRQVLITRQLWDEIKQ